MNIKDYLHLYMACQMQKSVLTHDDITPTYTLSDENFDYSLNYTEDKPILRPLGDMTEEESKEVASIRPNVLYGIPVAAELTRYLLSKHFDLFGLIDADLAIDATKQKEGI